MKIIITKYEDHSEVTVRSSEGFNIHTYVFDVHDEAKAFVQGWNCAQRVINGLVQSLPQNYELVKG